MYTYSLFQWDLVCGDSVLATTATSVFMAGLLVGALVSGNVSDR